MNIVKFDAKEAFDALGSLTIACHLELEDGTRVRSSIPSNFFAHISIANHSTFIQKTIHVITTVFAPVIVGRVPDTKLIDAIILEINDEHSESYLHNSILFLISSTICKAQAIVYQCEVFELLAEISGSETVSLPFPLITLLDSVSLSSNYEHPIKKIFLIPVGAPDFKVSCQQAALVTHEVKNIITASAKLFCVTNNGGISFVVDNFYEPLDTIMRALKKTELNDVFVLGIECNAQATYNVDTKKYALFGQQQSSDDLIALYKKIADTYPLFSLEDCFAHTDTYGWSNLYKDLGDTLQIVGNTLFTLDNQQDNLELNVDDQNDSAFADFITALSGSDSDDSSTVDSEETTFVNSIIMQPYDLGTITENLHTLSVFKNVNANIIVAHGNSETNDTFLADFAVGISSGQVKIGGLARGEHIAKYNRLIEIEDTLTSHMLDQID